MPHPARSGGLIDPGRRLSDRVVSYTLRARLAYRCVNSATFQDRATWVV